MLIDTGLKVLLNNRLLCSPARKVLRFMTGDKYSNVAGSKVDSPYKTSPISNDGGIGPLSPRAAHRKIAKTPFKVCCRFYQPIAWLRACAVVACHHLVCAKTQECHLEITAWAMHVDLRQHFQCDDLSQKMSSMQVLDAPALQDDFYLNLIDWSSQNFMAVGLGSCVYLWSAATSKVRLLQLVLVYCAAMHFFMLTCLTHRFSCSAMTVCNQPPEIWPWSERWRCDSIRIHNIPNSHIQPFASGVLW